MRTTILAFVLSTSLLCPSPSHASLIPMRQYAQSEQDRAVDYMKCDHWRYHNLRRPKIDVVAQVFMQDCMDRRAKYIHPRRTFRWHESVAEATAICNAYVAKDVLDASSDFRSIKDTNDFAECLREELAP